MHKRTKHVGGFRKAGTKGRGTSLKARSRTLVPRYLKEHISGFPQHERQTLRWANIVGNTSLTAGSYFDSPYILNGAFDPDFLAASTQPAGFAKYMAVYTKYFVKAARITVNFANQSSLPFVFGITVTTNTTTLTNFVGSIQPGLCNFTTLCGSPDNKTISESVDIEKFLDVKRGTSLYPNYAGDVGANPLQIVVAHVWGYDMNVSTGIIYAFNVIIDFDVDFYDPKPFA